MTSPAWLPSLRYWVLAVFVASALFVHLRGRVRFGLLRALTDFTVLLAPSVRVFIEQRSAISKLQAEIAQEQAEQDELKKEIARWDDPEYIKQQARDRIFYVMPGETRYMVTGTEGLSESKEHASKAAPSDLPWVDALWDSVKRSATDSPAAK